MFLKQYNYKPRSGSQSGPNDAAQAVQQPAQAVADTTANQGSISAAAAGRRRSSAGQFAGLQGYKRNSEDASHLDAHAQGGVLGQMWTNFTKK